MTATFMESARCPAGHHFKIRRRTKNAGLMVRTTCKVCGDFFDAQVGGAPLRALNELARNTPTLERHVEAYLVKRVKDLGGEVRKFKWIGRNGAPDRVVMLPGSALEFIGGDYVVQLRPPIWIEVKAPGKAATFPANAHERAQHREHERMRKMGQRVELVDSYEQIEEILK